MRRHSCLLLLPLAAVFVQAPWLRPIWVDAVWFGFRTRGCGVAEFGLDWFINLGFSGDLVSKWVI